MKVIVHIVQHLAIGGIESQVLALQQHALQDEHIHIVSLEMTAKQALVNWPRLQQHKDLHFLDKKPGVQWSLVKKLSNLLKTLKADIVHCHHLGPLLYGGLAAKWAKVSCLRYSEHDTWHLDHAKQRLLQQLAFKLFKPTVIADCDQVAEQCKKIFVNTPIHVIHNGIDCEQFVPGDKQLAREKILSLINESIGCSAIWIGCAGRMESVKGQAILIQAIARCEQNIHVFFAGDGSQLNHCQQLAKQLNIAKRCHFLANVVDMLCFYQSLDIFCSASLAEGMPQAPLEAQACNIPAILTDVGGSKECLCPHTGMLIAANDANAMAVAIIQMLERTNMEQPRTFIENSRSLTNMQSALRQLP